MLTRVTITGADDAVNPERLVALTRRFPFVEWGVLWSRTRAGSDRYPTLGWCRNLYSAMSHLDFDAALSAHLCGSLARDVLDNGWALEDWRQGPYSRVQVNGFRPSESMRIVANLHSPVEYICQVRDEASLQAGADFANSLRFGSVLYDPSGGRGIEAFRWPVTPFATRMGFAGGIKPENVLDVLRDIGPRDGGFWIDMESGVRDENGRFDLDRVEDVLAKCAPFGQAAA